MRLVDAFKQQRRRLWLGFVLYLLTVVSGIALLAISGWFITAAALTGIATAAGVLAVLDIFTPGTAIRFFALLRTVSRYFERVLHHEAILRIQAWWRVQLFNRLTQLPTAQFTRLRAGTVVQRLTQDLTTLDSWYLRLIAPQRVAAVALLVVWLLLAAINSAHSLWLVLLSAAMLLTLWLLAVPVAKAVTASLGRAEVIANNEFRQRSMDCYEGAAELFASRQWQQHAGGLAEQGAQLVSLQQQRLRRTLWLEMAVHGLLQLLAVLVLGVGLLNYAEGVVSLPLVVMQSLAILALAEIMQPLAEQSGQVGLVAEARSRITALPTELQAQPIAPEPVQKINLQWQQVHAIIGASGSGKSTLAGYAAGVLGSIQNAVTDAVVAEQLANLPRQQKGYLPQSNYTLAGTIADNLRIAAQQAAAAELWQALAFAELKQEVQAMPEGLNTWLGTGGVAISGGQARRLMIARIYLQNPQYVVLDEPFTGLDERTATKLLTNLEQWLPGRTAIFCAHNQESVPQQAKLTLLTAKVAY